MPGRVILPMAIIATVLLTGIPSLAQDAVGIYFDPAFTVADTVNQDVPHLATGYLVLRDPTQTAGGIGGWECRILFQGYEPAAFWTPAGGGTNYANPPDFVVGYQAPLLVTGPDVLLATLDMYVAETTPFEIEMVPLRNGEAIPDAMSYVPYDDPEAWTPMAPVTGTPVVASYNWVPFCEPDPGALAYGARVIGSVTSRDVEVTNAGGGVLTVDASISGTSEFYVQSGSGPFQLARGESGTIRVAYHPADAGADSAVLDLGTGCTPIPLTGEGRDAAQSFTVSPTSHDFGAVAVGAQGVSNFAFSNTGDFIIDVTLSFGGCPEFSSADTTFSVSPGQVHSFPVAFAPSDTVDYACTLTLEPGLVDIPLSGAGREPVESYEVVPSMHDFGTIIAGAATGQGFSLTNTGDLPVEYTLALAEPAGWQLSATSFTVYPQGTRYFGVTFAPPDSGVFDTALTIEPGSTVVPLLGQAGTSADLVTVAPEFLDFGEQTPGSQTLMSVRVSQTSTEPLYLDPFINGSVPFHMVSPPEGTTVEVAPGSFVDFIVEYTPQLYGEDYAYLVFPSVSKNVRLDGICATPTDSVVVNPAVLDFGNMEQWFPIETSVQILNFTDHAINFLPELMDADQHFYIVSGYDPSPIPIGGSRVFFVGFRPMETGLFGTTLTMGPEIPSVPVTGRGLETTSLYVWATPRVLDFGFLRADSFVDLEVRIINTSPGPVGLDIFLDPAGAPFSVVSGGSLDSVPAGFSVVVGVRYAPTGPGAFAAELHLSSDDRLPPVPVTGSAESEGPYCVLSTSRVIFAPTPVGGGDFFDVTVTNTGDVPIDLVPTSTDPSFTGFPSAPVLPPGEAGVLTVVYAPAEAGEHSGIMNVGSESCSQMVLYGSAFVDGDGGATEDLVGLYFDGPGGGTSIQGVSDGEMFDGYLVLHNPMTFEGITGYECRLLTKGGISPQGAVLPSGGINLTPLPEFTVTLDTPLPATGDVLLATVSFLATGTPDHAPIALAPKVTPTVADAMIVSSGPADTPRPMSPASGRPVVAWVNNAVSGVGDGGPGGIPAVGATRLLPNVPNPFNPETVVHFELARSGRVRIDVFDVMGRRVASLLDEERTAGQGQVRWRGRDSRGRVVSSGAYYVRLEHGRRVDTRKVMLLK